MYNLLSTTITLLLTTAITSISARMAAAASEPSGLIIILITLLGTNDNKNNNNNDNHDNDNACHIIVPDMCHMYYVVMYHTTSVYSIQYCIAAEAARPPRGERPPCARPLQSSAARSSPAA